MKRLSFAVSLCLVVVVGLVALNGRQAKLPDEAAIDKVFARWSSATPGCAVGVSEGGKVVLREGLRDGRSRARRAELARHDLRGRLGVEAVHRRGGPAARARREAVARRPGAGSTSPSFPTTASRCSSATCCSTRAACATGARSRAIAGWPRTTRVYTQAHVLDIVSRQKALNFEPGTNWSYSNTGYNLAAIIVSRVSGQPFAEFCRLRIFEPLGMTHTSWRDDFRRIVKGRAIAYEAVKDGYEQDMPFENVYGNGGLLTTVGDLLKWNENAVDAEGGRRGVPAPRADARPLQQRDAARLRDGALHPDLRGRARSEPQRFHRRLPRLPDALSQAAPVGGRAVQRLERDGRAVRARGGGNVPRGLHANRRADGRRRQAGPGPRGVARDCLVGWPVPKPPDRCAAERSPTRTRS